MPTQQEVDEVVANLRPSDSVPPRRCSSRRSRAAPSTSTSTVGFGGVLLARPNDDGTWETKCVFTLEEGAEFLGIVVDDAAR